MKSTLFDFGILNQNTHNYNKFKMVFYTRSQFAATGPCLTPLKVPNFPTANWIVLR